MSHWRQCNDTICKNKDLIIQVESTAYLNIFEDQVYDLLVTVFFVGNGIFQQDNVSCDTALVI